MGSQGVLMHMGNEGWPVWSDSTDKLVQIKAIEVNFSPREKYQKTQWCSARVGSTQYQVGGQNVMSGIWDINLILRFPVCRG